MQTECMTDHFEFEAFEGRKVVGAFDGGAMTSDAGCLLLRQADKTIGLIDRVAGCFTDLRHPDRIVHSLRSLLSQRIMGLALGYEDVNDHDLLRNDPVFALVGSSLSSARIDCAPLAGKSTLNRLEHCQSGDLPARYHKFGHDGNAIERLFVDLFIEAHAKPPREIVIDVDATDDPLHGEQEGRFYHGYYGCYCYLPLYIFCGRDLLGMKLRPSNIDGSAGAKDEIERIVGHIRSHWPDVRIIIRGDSGFARDELMTWLEQNGVDYLFGLAKNSRLLSLIEAEMEKARKQQHKTGKPARVFADFVYKTRDSWSCSRRVVAKAEHLDKGANPRFVVTSLKRGKITAKRLYEKLYCGRGDAENRIKECQLDLFADRTSTKTMAANQLRLWFAGLAYVLLCAVRRIGLAGTSLAKATCGTIRLKLLKIAALVRVSVRRIKVAMASACPFTDEFSKAHERILAAAR